MYLSVYMSFGIGGWLCASVFVCVCFLAHDTSKQKKDVCLRACPPFFWTVFAHVVHFSVACVCVRVDFGACCVRVPFFFLFSVNSV